MGDLTRISWTDATWNPWQGCHKVSPGCKNCYAERIVENRMGKDFREIRMSSRSTFYAPIKWTEPRKVFTCSISDFFIEEADVWRPEAWDVIRRTPRHTYQILTKRPERIEDSLPHHWGTGWPNVWLGTSTEDQERFDERIRELERVYCALRFLSCEPLLGPIDFGERIRILDWVIVGGESGPNFRPMEVSWAKSIRDQCMAAGVPFFFKQSSGQRSEMNPFLDGKEYREFPSAGYG